jgi:hypothetical protein
MLLVGLLERVSFPAHWQRCSTGQLHDRSGIHFLRTFSDVASVMRENGFLEKHPQTYLRTLTLSTSNLNENNIFQNVSE